MGKPTDYTGGHCPLASRYQVDLEGTEGREDEMTGTRYCVSTVLQWRDHDQEDQGSRPALCSAQVTQPRFSLASCNRQWPVSLPFRSLLVFQTLVINSDENKITAGAARNQGSSVQGQQRPCRPGLVHSSPLYPLVNRLNE